jgi:CubicO group peptidase (beta-lactamase class C family)
LPNWRTGSSQETNKEGKLELQFPPGTRFLYSGEGYEYLALVLAHLNKTDLAGLEAVFQREVAVPLGMAHASFTRNEHLARHKATGHAGGVTTGDALWPWSRPFGAAFSLHAEAASYARFLAAILRGQGLRRTTIDDMLQSQVSGPDDPGTRLLGYAGEGISGTAFGLGIGIQSSPSGTRYRHSGNNGNFQSGFLLDKATQNGYVFFTNCDRGNEMNQRLEALLAKNSKKR